MIASSVPGVAAAATTQLALAGDVNITFRAQMVESDTTIGVTASGLCPGQIASIELDKRTGPNTTVSVTVSTSGTARFTFAPRSVGDYNVWVRQRAVLGIGCDRTGVEVLRVVDDCSTAPGAIVPTEALAIRRSTFIGGEPLPSTTTTTEPPTTTTEPPTTTTEPPTTTTEPPTTTTEPPTTTTEPPTTTTEPPPVTTLPPTPPPFPSGNVVCDPGPEPPATTTTTSPATTVPGSATTEPGAVTTLSPTSGPITTTGDAPVFSTIPADEVPPDVTVESEAPVAGGGTGGGGSGGSKTAAPSNVPVISRSLPDGDAVELAVTRFPDAPSAVKARGFCTSSLVTFTLGGVVVGAVLAAPDGTAAFNVPTSSLPSEPGVYEMVATSNGNDDPDCDLRETTTYVVPAYVASSGPAPASGDSSSGQTEAPGAAGPLVQNGQLNLDAIEDAGIPVNGSNPDRMVRVAAAAGIAGLAVLLAIVGARRRRIFG